MTRLPIQNRDDLTPEQRVVHDRILSSPRGGVRGPLAIWLHRPDLADRAQKLGLYCRYGSSLPPRLSELAILTTARIWDASFEWETHRPHALSAGVSEDVVNALAEDRTPEFKVEEEELVYLFTRELNLKRSVSDLLFERTVSCLGRDGTVDLVGVLGYYGLISMTIKAFDIPPPS
ncbi:MAG: carboxymuconolactone decarboxylase family protein [Pseudomonadota bacterium]|nr:carboxymuconolactone decarboxylase family protein [Pseudomonadota bacterium]MEC8245602.1 carboxymuconolactone decarboxylase family protein [Pseudomonadota bacterium]